MGARALRFQVLSSVLCILYGSLPFLYDAFGDVSAKVHCSIVRSQLPCDRAPARYSITMSFVSFCATLSIPGVQNYFTCCFSDMYIRVC